MTISSYFPAVLIFSFFLSPTLYAQVNLTGDSISNFHTDTFEIRRVQGQNEVYHLKPAVDVPIIAVGTVWALYALPKVYSKGGSTEEQILSLNKNNINGFDRWAVYPYSDTYNTISYYPFYASIPLPFVFFLTGEKTRNDFWKLSYLYWETMAVTGMFGVSATYFVDKYRPYAYTSETAMDKRMSQNAKNSFYAGHVEIVAVSTFFISKVYSDYYPESNIKWVFYGAASVVTGATAYLRLWGGQHFPSDILLGAGMGALSGILVPQAHKNRINKNHEMGLLPFRSNEAYGLTFTYLWK
jgi:hypothetical protein